MTRRTMTRPEAADLLRVRLDALPDEVQNAYRARVGVAHPDRGGDVELFRRVVAARTAMLIPTEPTARPLSPSARAATPPPVNTEKQATVVLVVAALLVVAWLAGWWLVAHQTVAAATGAPPVPTRGGSGWANVWAAVALVIACVPGLFVLRSLRGGGARPGRGTRLLPRGPRGPRRSLMAGFRALSRGR